MQKKSTATASPSGRIGIKNWSRFQHFKDRRPPWIKLYREILDDPEWFILEPEHAKVLVMFWLIASEGDGYLPDVKTLAFRLRTSISDVNQSVIALSHWLIHDDIKPISRAISQGISSGYQDDAPETETEREKEGEREAEPEERRVRRGKKCAPAQKSLTDYHTNQGDRP